MKVAFLNDRIYAYATRAPSACGGAERQQWLLARALAARDWAVIVGVRHGLRAGLENVIDRVRFVGVGDGHVLSTWRRFFISHRPDWWYWRCASHLFGFGVGLAKTAGVRCIFAAGFDRDVTVHRALFDRPRLWPAYAMGLAGADRILLQHAGQYADLPSVWQSKAHMVRSIAVACDMPEPHSARPRQVAWIAALRQAKRPDLLLEIARHAPDVRFVVCGGPSSFMTQPGYSERTLRLFQTMPNIDYRGQVPPDEAVRIAGESALLLSTSDEEGFPSTFIEAWAQGTPVISLKIDPDDVIKTAQIGAVCLDPAAAATAILDLLRSPERRDAMAARARQHVATAHSAPAVVAAFEHALASPNPRSRRHRNDRAAENASPRVSAGMRR